MSCADAIGVAQTLRKVGKGFADRARRLARAVVVRTISVDYAVRGEVAAQERIIHRWPPMTADRRLSRQKKVLSSSGV
jgi:hypothetical protein